MATENYDAGEFIGGNYVKKEHLAAGPQRFTICGVERVEFEARNGRKAEQVLQLDLGEDRKFSLSTKTNIRILIKAYGRKTADWINKPIILYVDPNVMFGGSLVGGVRVRIPTPMGMAADLEEAMPTAG